MNWAAYIVTAEHNGYIPGDVGVFRTTIEPGISDQRYGTMYVVGSSWVDSQSWERYRSRTDTLPPHHIAKLIESHYK